MKYLYSALLPILLFVNIVKGQTNLDLEGWPNAKVVGSNLMSGGQNAGLSGNDYTSGIYTYNPRVEGGYYLVDIYLVRSGIKTTYGQSGTDYNNGQVNKIWFALQTGVTAQKSSIEYKRSCVGAFNVAFKLKSGATKTFTQIYESVDFICNPELLTPDATQYGSAIKYKGKTFAVASLAVAYEKNEDAPYNDDFEQVFYMIPFFGRTPIYAGTLKLKIRDFTATASLDLVPTSCTVTAYTGSANALQCSWYSVVGWLDGKDIDIPLTEGPKAPDAPTINPPATNALCLAKNNGEVKYTYSIKEADKVSNLTWIVSTPNSTTSVSPTFASWTPASNSQSTTVTWKKAGTYWVNAYVEVGGVKSEYAHTEITIKERPQAVLSFNQGGIYKPGNQIIATVSDGKNLSGSKTYGWIKPNEAPGNQKTVNDVIAGSSHPFQAYVTVEGCSDTTAVQTITVGDNPKLIVELEEVYALCAGGVGELQVKRVMTEDRTDVDLASCNFAWKKDGGSTNVSSTANCTVTAAGTYSVTVTQKTGSATGTVSKTVTQSLSNAPVLGDKTFYVKSTSARPVIWTTVQGGVSASDLSWNWSPASKLNDATLEKPTVNSLVETNTNTNANAFSVYVVDGSNCRSKDAQVKVLVTKDNGLDVTIDPGDAITLCKNNRRYLTAKVNGAMGTTLSGYTYDWTPADYLEAVSGSNMMGPQVIFDATNVNAGTYEVFVTATRGSYSSTQKIAVTVKSDEAPRINNLTAADFLACTGSFLEVEVIPALPNTGVHYTYTWTNGGTTTSETSARYTFATDGEYDMALKVTAPSGCEADTMMWPHLSIRTAPKDLALSLSGSNGTGGTVLCGSGNGTLTLSYSGSKPEIIRWYRNGTEVTSASGNTTLAVTEADAGSTYKVEASNGVCESSTPDFSFTHTALPASLSINVEESCGEIALVANPTIGFTEYTWSANGLTAIGGTTSSSVRFSGNVGTYTVNLTAKNGGQCQMTATKSVDLKQKPELAWAANNPTNECEGDVLRVTSKMTPMQGYVWKNGSVTAASTTNAYTLPLNGGNIMAIGTAPNGCKDTVSGTFAGHSKPDLAWQPGKEPANKYYAGDKIVAAVRATKGDGNYHYYYTSPYTLDNATGVGKDDYMAAINGTNDFFVMVADGNGCRDTLRKAISVEGQELLVTIVNKHDAVACTDGSAILTARVQHGVGELQYQWYRNGSVIAGATDSVYVVNFSSVNDVYKVKVICPLTTGEGEATKQWSGSPGTAPRLTVLADVITILPGEVAILGAEAFSPVSNTFNWHWTNPEKLAAGEDTKQYPHTVSLRSSSTKYQVYVLDERNCMSNIGDVEVRVDPTNGLRVAVVPESAALCRNNSVELTATANRAITTCQWYSSALPNDNVTLDKNNARAVFKTASNTVPKDYQQVAKVTCSGYTALALNTVTVKSDRAPQLPVMKDGCGGNELFVLAGDDVPDDGFVWYVDGNLIADNHGFKYAFDNSDHAVKVVMKADGNECWSDTLRVNVWQTPEIEGDMIADKTTVTKNDKAKLEVTLSDATTAYKDMTGSWSTTPTGFAGTPSGTHNRLMTTSALTENNTTVTYTISNTHNAECKDTRSLNLTVFDPATGFDISLDSKVFAKCEGETVAVTITPINANGVGVNYELTGTKDGTAFEALKISRTGVVGPWTTDFRDLAAGEYQLFIAATETKNSSIARDTVSFTVHPNPTVTMGTLASTDLCTGSGDSLRVVLTFANGAPWKLDYREGGVTQQAITGITSTDYVLYLKTSGSFSVMEVTNTHGCKATAKPAVVNINDITPKVEVDMNGFISFCQGGNKAKVAMNLKGGSPDWKIYYTLNGGTQQTASANASPYNLELTESGVLKVDSVVNAEGCRATITSGTLFDGVEVEDDRLRVEFLTPDPEAICSSGGEGASIALDITPEPTAWPLQVNCLIRLEEGGERQLNVQINATDKDQDGHYLLKDITRRGTYILRSIIDATKCRAAIGEDSVKVMSVGTLPEVNIDSTDFVAFKGQEFVLNAVDKQADFTYSWSLNDGAAAADNGGIRAVMEDEDMVYRLIARDAGGCVAEDTVTVYRLPDAPELNIAKGDGENTLKIQWTHDGKKTNGYKLWHNEWDAYAIESAYTETKSFAATATPEAVLNITDKDTLEFFYLLAFREIDLKDGQGKRRFNSLPSDTVGYKVDRLLKNEGTGTSNNPITWVFDMPEIQTSEDLFNTNKANITAVRSWVMAQQSMTLATTKNPLAGRPNQPDYRNVFDLEVGRVYEIAVGVSFNMIQYGKLGNRMIVNFENAPTDVTNNNLVCVPLHKVYLKASDALYDEVINMADAIRIWVFADQSWTYSTMKNPLAGRPNQPKYRNVFRVIPGLAIQIPYNRDTNQTVWE